MNLLLDTHVFIWWSISPKRLSSQVEKLVSNVDNTLFLSLASIWEMQIKSQLGKLDLDVGLSELVQKQQEVNSLNLLPIEVNHIYALTNLADHHKDPFDRLIIAQSIVENIDLISIDKVFDQYLVNRIW